MKYLITGSSGWIGSSLKTYINLKLEGSETIDYDIVDGNDLLDKENLYRYIDKVDTIYHLGAEVGIGRSWVNPDPYYRVNVLGSANIFRIAREMNKKVIYASTGEVKMGNTPYAASKIGAEAAGIAELQKGLDVVFLRILSLYGEGQPKNSILPKFIYLAINKKPLTIHGTGEQRKDYIHMDDVVEAFWAAQDLPKGTITDLGSGSTLSVKKIAELVAKKISYGTQIVYVPTPRPGEKLDMSGDMEALYKIGWKPKVTFDKGLERMVRYYGRPQKAV